MITNKQLVNMFIDGFGHTVKNCTIILKPMLPGTIAFYWKCAEIEYFDTNKVDAAELENTVDKLFDYFKSRNV